MLIDTAQLFLRILALGVFGVMLYVIQQKMNRAELSFTLGFVWSAALFSGMALAAFPGIVWVLSGLVGTVLPSNLLFFGAILFGLIINFVLTLKNAKQSRSITVLCQELGILREEVASLKAGRRSDATAHSEEIANFRS